VGKLVDRFTAGSQGKEPVAPVGKLIGFRPTSIEPGKAVFELEAGPQHANPMGTLHGGIICDVADAAMGVAYVSTLGDDESFTTIEMKVNFLRPFWTGTLVATGHVVKGGRMIGLVECDVTDKEGRLVARASSTCMTIRGDSSEGRDALKRVERTEREG
jgi:uncharacterized protein (TIGR00369 family)